MDGDVALEGSLLKAIDFFCSSPPIACEEKGEKQI